MNTRVARVSHLLGSKLPSWVRVTMGIVGGPDGTGAELQRVSPDMFESVYRALSTGSCDIVGRSRVERLVALTILECIVSGDTLQH